MNSEEYDLIWPEPLRTATKAVIRKFEVEQKPLREYNLKEYKKYSYYWATLQNRFWSDTIRDWRPYEEGIASNPDLDIADDDIGRVINVYRATGESIIAGLSASIPGVGFAPDDADNIDDVTTAKAYTKISDLINIHNNASLKLAEALFILYNQSFVACYNYYDTSDKYGTYRKGIMIPSEEQQEQFNCPMCGDELLSDVSSSYCPGCDQNVEPEITSVTVPVLIPTFEDCPKSREVIEFYGPMNIQIPFYASDMKAVPYLILEKEFHQSIAKELYPWIADKIKSTRAYDTYEKWARQPSEAFANQESDIVTVRQCWLRPSCYWMMPEEQQEEFRERFPNGMYAAFVDDVFAEAYDEDLDDHWTITKSPISEYLHAPPMGRVMADIQDMTNSMYNLTLRTIEFGVPMTFADSNAINWDNFKKSPSEPGQVYPAKMPTGQNMSAAFHEVRTATLSKEVDSFQMQLQQAGQFVSGAFPSIYGGTLQGGSGTYKEYESSRTQALQRLSLTWKMLNIFWKDWTYKACKEYAKNLDHDEKYTQKQGATNYINVWIKQSELKGQIGFVEAETSDQFPVSLAQQRDLLLALIQFQNPQINAIIGDSQNLGDMSRLLGFSKLYVPGDDQRNKQLNEIMEMLKSGPVPAVDPNTGMPAIDQNTGQEQMQSSVPIEPIDNDQVHAETVQAFLTSDPGIFLKVSNPQAYQNIMLHFQEHQQNMQMQQQNQLMMQMQMEKAKIDMFPPNRVTYSKSEVVK